MAEPTRVFRGTRGIARQLAPGSGEAGLTLIELIVAFSLMLILSVMALPVARVKIQREKERRLRYALHEIRKAIDRHKDMADEGKLGMLDPDNHGYPESLETMVEGVRMDPQAGDLAPGAAGMGTGLGASRTRGLDASRTGAGGFGSSRDSQAAFGSGRDRSRDGAFGGQGDRFGRDGDPFDRDDEGPETIRFLRSIPVDPMTGQKEWGMLSISDDPLARSWSGRNVFDVYSLSSGIALDGTRYGEW